MPYVYWWVQPVVSVSGARQFVTALRSEVQPTLSLSRASGVAETPNDGRPAVSRAADTKTTGWTLWDTYDTAYQPLTSHEAAGRRSSNGRQGAGRRVHPPGTEHPPRAILAVHEGDHLNHLVIRSRHVAELLVQLAKMVPPASFSTGLGLDQRRPPAPARHTTLATTEGLRRARARFRQPP